MPDILMYFITFILTMLGILYFIFSCIDDTLDYKAGWLVIPVSLCFWLFLYWSADWEYIDHTNVVVHKVDNIDVVNVNNDILNLNYRFCRSFKDGDKITIKEKSRICYYGIFPSEIRCKYELDSEQPAEKDIKP